MITSLAEAAIVVFGASGLVGRRVCAQLAKREIPFEVAGRSGSELEAIAGSVHTHIADAADSASLARAFAGARVIVNAAAPLADTAGPVLEAALTAGAHYVDVGGEQAVLHALYERHESTARHAGLVALPGAGVDSVIADLAATWAAQHVLGLADEGAPVRTEPARVLAEDSPLDEVITSYVFDDLVLSAGSQRALFAASTQRPLVWRRDRWEPGRAGERRHVNAGSELGGERDAVSYAGSDVLAVPRHIAVEHVASYVSTTRSAGATRALGLLARALPFVPKAASELLAPYADPDADYQRTRFAVVAQVRRGFSAAQVVVRGRDLYETTAAIVAWCAQSLATRISGPTGMRTPAELFRSPSALREIATLAALSLEPSFGSSFAS